MPDFDAAISDINNALAPPALSFSAPPQPGLAPDTPTAAPPSRFDAAIADLSKTPDEIKAALPQPPEHEGGAVRNLAAGGNEAVANTLGAPVDLMTGALNLGARGINAAGNALGYDPGLGQIQNPLGGSDSIKSLMGVVGADPRNVGANDALDRVARGTGAGVVGMVAPTAAARQIAGQMVPGVAQSVIQALGDVGTPTATAVGAAGGAGGAGAAEAVPDQYKALANMGGQLAAGGAVGAGAAGIAKLAELGMNAGRNIVGPFVPSVAKDLAAQKLVAGASDPAALTSTLAEEPKWPQVPGSEPTTFQLTGDSGVGQLERATRTANPAPFLDRAADQNAARVGALQTAAPEAANPGAVGDLFRQHLAAIDQAGDASVSAAQQNAKQTLAATGGTQAPEAYGEALRTQMEAAKTATKQSESRVWKAIDPDGTLTINPSPVRQAATDIAAQTPPTAMPPQGDEAAIFSAAQGLSGASQPFSYFAALRTWLNNAIRQEVGTNGQSPAWRRMVMLRGTMDDTMAGTAQTVAQDQAQQVANGAMSPEDTMTSRLAQDAQGHYLSRDARIPSAINQLAAGGNGGVYSQPSAGRGSPGIAGTLGEAGAPTGGSGIPSGNPSLQGQAQPVANFDAAAAARYRAAADATKARVQTFNNPVVGPALQERGGFYRTPEAALPQRFMGGAPQTQAFLGAGAQPATMQDALVADLRRSATDPDGTLNTGKYQTWLRNRGDALQQFPGLQQRLGNAASAQDAVDSVAATAKTQTDAYKQSAARYFLNAEPRQAVTAAFGSRTPVDDFAQLSKMVGNSPAAKDGLQRAIVDHMMAATQSNRAAGMTGTTEINPAAFQRYLARNRTALAGVFSPDQLDTMDAVAADLQRADLSIGGSKIPGSPGTAQDLAGVKTSILGNLVRRAGGGVAGYMLGGLHGAIEGMIGGEAANAVRRAGMDNVNKLVEDALLNPDRARALLMNYTPRTSTSIADRIRSTYGAATLATMLSASQKAQTTPLAAAIAAP